MCIHTDVSHFDHLLTEAVQAGDAWWEPIAVRLAPNEMPGFREACAHAGLTFAVTLAQEHLCGTIRLADFDLLDLSNLNRIAAGCDDLGVPKTTIYALSLRSRESLGCQHNTLRLSTAGERGTLCGGQIGHVARRLLLGERIPASLGVFDLARLIPAPGLLPTSRL